MSRWGTEVKGESIFDPVSVLVEQAVSAHAVSKANLRIAFTVASSNQGAHGGEPAVYRDHLACNARRAVGQKPDDGVCYLRCGLDTTQRVLLAGAFAHGVDLQHACSHRRLG